MKILKAFPKKRIRSEERNVDGKLSDCKFDDLVLQMWMGMIFGNESCFELNGFEFYKRERLVRKMRKILI